MARHLLPNSKTDPAINNEQEKRMKKKILGCLRAGSVGLIAAGFTCALQATPITGTINFTGGAVLNNDDITAATSVRSFYQATDPSHDWVSIQIGSETGSYLGVGDLSTKVTFTPFSFSDSSVIPLWTFTAGTVTYSFDATSVQVVSRDANHISLAGSGIAHISNLDDTTGSWSINLGPDYTGSHFTFGASTAVPDGGMTAMMLGVGFIVLGLLRRKLA